ncbi:PepSY-associated TM helix domain-containing protein [Mucilaginibacter sp. SP1R1]|uniref:PepSY-associated TM helix domain-containing protein n=1 Tax=Mucilaginibacter sp. SP1R1 TaxID=2723091 RepID=UPI001611EF7E|nr:PepSY-associated TM helix domain-containing protein [Mucilaginibacter sp. SP1R1]MBB6151171.1 putative iron-regulated membrane protein [Mucilaginibacter sp. SP1R1]
MKKFKAIAGWLHLWIGLVTGIIVVIVSITGCIQVFDEELFNLFHRDLVKVEKTGSTKPVSELLAIAQKAVGKKKPVTDIKISEDNYSYVFTASKANKKQDIGLSYFSQFKYQEDIYVNQYTGKVLGIIDTRYEFFNVMEQLHRQLLLVKPVGSVIVGTAVLLFLLMMITGFILWLPKNYKQFKQRVTIKWGAKWKRVNYDTHNSFGFFVLPIAIIIAITGLVWAFKWWETGVFKMLGSSGKVSLVRTVPAIATADTTGKNTVDVIYANLRQQIGDNYKVIGFNLPGKKSNVVMAFTYVKNTTDSWNNMSYYYFDSRTGKMFDKLEHQNKPLALKWRNSNKYIHTGRIFGWPTQILAFLAALVCASLPITGFLIWWGKRNKKKPAGKRLQVSLN